MIYPHNVAIIVLNYNNAKDTIECIKSLLCLNREPGAIVVVDNNSKDNSVDEIKNFLIDINANKNKLFIVVLNTNEGYSKGNNEGIKFIKKYKKIKSFWILNNDTIVDKYSLDALCIRMNQANKPSIIGSTIVQAQNMKTLQCASGYYSTLKIAFDKPLLAGVKITDILDVNERKIEKKISYVIGASFFIHSNVLKIGYFREDFFLYAEEMEYCIRAKKFGIPLLWAKDSIVYHKEGGSTKASSSSYTFPEWVDYLMIRNRIRVVIENFIWLLPLCWLFSPVIILKRILLNKTLRLSLIYRAMWDGTVGRMGKPKIFYNRCD